jgi:peptidyl-prolyl cis-trans isomerase C
MRHSPAILRPFLHGRRPDPKPELDHRMRAFTRNFQMQIAGALLAGAAIVAGPAMAQETPAENPAAAEPAQPAQASPAPEPMRELPPDPKRVYAIVDGVPITEADLSIVAEQYEQQLGQIPQDVRVSELLDVLIDMKLLAKAAEAAGVDKKEEVVRRLGLDRDMTLRNEYLREKAVTAVSDDAVKARYDKETAAFVPEDEYHLQHILLGSEEEAKTALADLEKGGDFATIAKERSIDPGSGARGGDLGFVPKGKTVPEFENAALGLEVGTYTKTPVKSQFGWHIIRLDEKRKSSPPTFAAEEGRIRNDLIREFVQAEVDAVRAAAKVEIVPPPPAETPGAPPAGDAPAAADAPPADAPAPAEGTPAPAEGAAPAPAP